MIKDKLIYIYPQKASFVNNDLEFLEKKYEVIIQDLDWGNVLKLPFNLIRQFFFLFMNARNSKAIIVNFGGYFSLLPALFGKFYNIKSYIILNGTDCVSFPTYNYGSLRKKTLKWFIKKSYENATKLLPVDESLIKQKHAFDEKVLQKEQGIQQFFPNLKTDINVIPNGLDANFWTTKSSEKRRGFITVGFVNSIKSFRLKGIDMFLKVAKEFPNENFTIIGMSVDFKKTIANFPKNVKTIPFLEKEDLKKQYQKHQFYIQVSVNEGFGCALVEAMLTGCIPIVSNVGALQNVTKKEGFIIEKKEINHFISVLKIALNLSENEKLVISKKVKENSSKYFDISIRENLLLNEIESI